MSAFSLQRILPVLLASALACGSVCAEEGTDKLSKAEIEKLDSLRLDYDLAREEIKQKQWVEPMDKLRSAYKTKMRQLQDNFAQSGDLKKALAARTAAKTDPTAATINAAVQEIASVQRIFTNTQKRMQEKLKQSLTQLARSYVTQLNAIKDKLTKDKRLDSALSIDEEIQKFVAELGLLTIDDLRKPSLSSGNLRKSKLGLVAYYPFNGNARDESGNRNDGEVKGATLTTDRHGKPSSAYSFDGKDDFIEVDDDPSLNFDSEMSIAFWIRPDSFGQRDQAVPAIVAKMKVGWVGNDPGGYVVYHDFKYGRKKINFFYNGVEDLTGNHANAPTHSEIIINEWNHWTVIYKQERLEWYLNGKLEKAHDGLAKAGDMFTSSPLHIGRNQHWEKWGFLTFFDGAIDDIRIYNRALSAKEVSAIYDSEKP